MSNPKLEGTRRVLSSLAALWLFAGCPTPLAGATAGTKGESLDTWTRRDLLPYLRGRLGRHPRLRGEPFEIVAVRGNEIPARMDGLTASIRQRMLDGLQSAPGVRLVRPVPMEPWHQYPGLDAVECSSSRVIHTQVTIEVGEPAEQGLARVAIRAIDRVQHEWVRGFNKIWIGRLTRIEQQERAHQVSDNDFRGTRQLPFTQAQMDLVASDLARKVSCHLQRNGEDRLRILPSRAPDGVPAFFEQVAQSLNQYLGRFPKVEWTSDPADAAIILRMNTQQVGPELHQLWVDVQYTRPSKRPLDLDAPLYVALQGTSQPTLELPQKSSSTSRVATRTGRPPLIREFELVVPNGRKRCEGSDVWGGGEFILSSGAHLASGSCFGLLYTGSRRATLYLLARDPAERLTQLLPNLCDALGLGEHAARLEALQELQLPRRSGRAAGYFRLDRQPGVERVYAVAVDGLAIETKLVTQIRQAGAESVCNRLEQPGLHVGEDFRATLDSLARRSDGRMAWRQIYFVHDAP